MNYYNEFDPHAAALLRELIKTGAIANGIVDTRSIEDVRPSDLAGFTQCHFFAGVGGWAYALRLAGWPDDKPVWTGSCPCQPFSQAGKGAGDGDERHLWPAWMHLIRQCKPQRIYGEQVASAIRFGWLDTVFDDLQNSGYACAAANIPAASVGAPHLRERVWFVGAMADAASSGFGQRHPIAGNEGGRQRSRAGALRCGDIGAVAIAHSERNDGRGNLGQAGRIESANGGELGHSNGSRLEGRAEAGCSDQFDAGAASLGRTVGNTDIDGCEAGRVTATTAGFGSSANATNWNALEWLDCIDEKQRPTKSGLSPLAHGIPRIMGPMLAEFLAMGIDPKNAKRLARASAGIFRGAGTFRTQQIRGYGNAIVPQVAAEFILATI